MFSDSHCHLRGLTDEVVEQAAESGVELALTSGIDLASSMEAILSARKYDIVKACVGIHPWNADQYSEDALHRLRELAADPEVVAISEIGLDYRGRRNREGQYVSEYIDKQIQRKAFRGQLRLAKELGLPVLVHDRTPDQEILDILKEMTNTETEAAIHGFSKGLAYANRCIDMGIYLSIGSRAISAKENEALRKAVKKIPLRLLLTETDSRSPLGVLTVAEKIAMLKGLKTEEVGKETTRNLKRFIKL